MPVSSPPSSTPSPAQRLPELAGRHAGAGWLTLLAVLLVLRRPDAFLHPQFWAEDGMFYVDALVRKGSSLFLPYAGYLHLVPRLTALAAARFDPLWAPAITTGTAFALTLVTFARLLSPRVELPLRGLLPLAVALLPDAREILFNLANVQWLLALGLVGLSVSRDPLRWTGHAGDAAFVLLAGLSGPFSLLLTPLLLVRAIMRRTRASIALAVLLALTAGVQGWFVSHNPEAAVTHATAFRWTLVPSIVGLRLGELLVPESWLPAPGSGLFWLGLAGVVILGGVIVLAWPRDSHRTSRTLLAGAFLFLTAAAFFRYRQIQSVFLEPHISPRYFFVPQALLLWLLISQAAAGPARRIAARLLLAGFLLVALRGFRLAPFVDLHWPDYAREIRAGRACTFPVNPPTMTISCPERKP